MEQIVTQGQRFIDQSGRERIFNGMNLVDKGKLPRFRKAPRNYFANDWAKSALLPRLQQRGFNLIRLGLIWDAVEPAPGQYDETYLDFIEQYANECKNLGIYFYLDMHQDLYASMTKSGDGAPSWATLTDNCTAEKPVAVWAEGYFVGKAVHNAFENFWNNTTVDGKGLQDHYAEMWVHVAQRFKDNPALLGWDLMNEPFPGKSGGILFLKLIDKALARLDTEMHVPHIPQDFSHCFDKGERIGMLKLALQVIRYIRTPARLKCLIQVMSMEAAFKEIVMAGFEELYTFDVEQYSPFLTKMANSIRSVTENGILMMANSYYSNLGIPYSAQPIKNGTAQEPKLAFAPHGYDILVDTPLYAHTGDARVNVIFNEHRVSQKRLDLPVVVGEWGAFTKGRGGLPHIATLLKRFDDNKWSHTFWCGSKKLMRSPVMKLLTRPYPQAVCGEIKRYGYDPKSKVFTLLYQQDRLYSQPTVVYLPCTPLKVATDCTYQLCSLAGTKAVLLELEGTVGRHHLRVVLK